MASTRQIINDLRAQANRLHRTGNDTLVNSLRRAAHELEGLEGELAIYRAACEILQDDLARAAASERT